MVEEAVSPINGLPLIKPPYGTISAINLDRGDIVWQIAHGDTPDNIRNALKAAGSTPRAPASSATTSAR